MAYNLRVQEILRMITSLFALAWMLAVQSCAAFDFEASQIKSIAKGIEKGREKDREIRDCSSFTMTKREVVEYFRRAKPVPETRLHDLEWSACFVGGTARIGAKLIKWRINALGAGVVEWPDSDEAQYFYEGEPGS